MSAFNSGIRVLAAETTRARNSGQWLVPLSGLIYGAATGFSALAAGTGFDWQSTLQWHGLLVTGMWVVVAVAAGGIVGNRDALARSGGTSWREPSVSSSQLAAIGTACLIFLLFCISSLLPQVALGIVTLGTAGFPAHIVVGAVIVGFVSALPAVVFGYFVGKKSWLMAIGIGIAWNLAATLQAESPHWMFAPWTWVIRAQLPILGIHQNAEPLELGNPLSSESPLRALTLGVLLTLVILLVGMHPGVHAVKFGSNKRHMPSVGSTTVLSPGSTILTGLARPLHLGSFKGALGFFMRRTPPPLWVLMGLSILGGIWISSRYSPQLLVTFAILIVLPGGACAASIMLAAAGEPGRRMVALRLASPSMLTQAHALLCLSLVTVMALATMATWIACGLRPDHAIIAAGCGVLVGTVASSTCAYLQQRFSTPAACLSAVGLMVAAVVVCGSPLGENTILWTVTPFGWATAMLSDPTRSIYLIPASLMLIALALWQTRSVSVRQQAE